MKQLIFLILTFFFIGCSKEQPVEPKPQCQSVTIKFKDTGELVIHWCKVCGEDLARFRAMPKEFPVASCDNRIQVLTIGKDNCK